MLIDTQYLTNTKKLVVSYVDKSGDIKLKYFDWENPQKFVACSSTDLNKHPRFKSWDDKNVKLESVTHPNRYAVYEFLDSLPQNIQDEIFEYNLPKIYQIDIETELGPDGYGTIDNPYTRILSISIVYEDKIILLGLKDMPEDMQERIRTDTNKYFEKFNADYKLRYVKYDDEFDMVSAFFNKMVPKMPVLSAWNGNGFDFPYLINRARLLKKTVNGKEYSINPNVCSPTKNLHTVYGTNIEMPMHRMFFDYMQLYEICDTSIKVKESSSLEFVSTKLTGVNKIKYNGSLQKLYEEDFEKFMYYNAVDSVLVQKIHDARNYISIIFAISSLAKIKVTDIINLRANKLSSIPITEGVLRGRFRDMDNIVLFKDIVDDTEVDKIEGGHVKDPVVGMNRWVSVYDFSSLYPSNQRMFYIAPENFVGVQDKNNKKYCENGVLIDDSMVVCVNGVVFYKRDSPTIKMLQDIFKDRKKNKNIMLSKKIELEKIEKEIKQLESEF